MTENIASAVNEIAQSVGVASTEIIPYYAKWYFAASIAYMLLGFTIMASGFWLFQKMWRWGVDENEDGVRVGSIIVFLVFFIIGGVFICANIGDFVCPEGIAYHRLISDIRGQ